MCAVAILVAHLLLAQLTLVLALVFAVDRQGQQVAAVVAARAGGGRAGLDAGGRPGARRRRASPPGRRAILGHLGGGHLAGRAGQPLAGFARRRELAAAAVPRRAGRAVPPRPR